MRVLMACHTDFDINTGACGCTVKLGESLRESGIDVDYYTYSDLPKNLDARIKCCLFSFFVYRHVQRYKKWDIIDATTSDTWILGRFRGKNKKPKIVISSHGLEHTYEENRIAYEKKASLRYKCWITLQLKLVELSLRNSDHICVLTHAEKEYIKERFSLPQERISVSYHSLPLYFRNLPDYQPPDEFKVLYVGTGIERKGIRYLLGALEEFSKHNINFSLTLAGLRNNEFLSQQAISDRLKPRINIIPFIENRALPQIYLTHSVFVFPSFYEGFGMVIAEAMACGIPIITTEVGVAREWIKDSINGIVIPFRDSSAIYTALMWAYNHPAQMMNYGRNAKSLIHEIDQGQEAKQRIEIYRSLIK